VLRGEVIPRFGVPPYLRFGNLPWLWLATLCGFVAIMMRRRERELPAAASV
jgi:apolipoprotein N-acyltransferase